MNINWTTLQHPNLESKWSQSQSQHNSYINIKNNCHPKFEKLLQSQRDDFDILIQFELKEIDWKGNLML